MLPIMRNERFSAASLPGAVRAFFSWWREELVSLLPTALRIQLQYNEHQLVITPVDDGLQIANCHHGQPESQISLHPDENGEISQREAESLLYLQKRAGSGVVLRLPDDHVLTFSFPLPLEAEKNLHEVVGYELGRHAPFKLEQVYFDYEELERQKEQKKVWVTASVVPRNQVTPTLSMLRAWGLVPNSITIGATREAKGEFCQLSSLNLLPPAARNNGQRAMNRVVKALTATALLLLLAVTGYPILLQEVRIAELRQRVEEVKAEAVNVQSMRQELELAAQASAYVMEQKRNQPEVLDVLNALTTLLPDDTWLERLEMKGNRVRIQGMSEDASSLIQLLENDPLLQKVSFDSPIVNDPRTERFRFQIVAQLAGGGDE